ncbi:hypothetical protein Godav_025088, partial [Gossypium davidsonii]|nr:hypothetical protein [Gossypium davidsonii]
ARLVVFPIKGKIWCFSRSIDQSASAFNSANTPSTVKELWKKISSNSKPLNANAELLVDFISNKMNNAWVGLEKAPEGSFKNKLHGFGLQLLARVKPSEILLKSISKEVTNVRIAYPPRGTVIHRKYFYGSVTLLPLTTALAVLPLPNIPFFWVLFRTYSHWRALQVRITVPRDTLGWFKRYCSREFLNLPLRDGKTGTVPWVQTDGVDFFLKSGYRARRGRFFLLSNEYEVGSEKLLELVSDYSRAQNPSAEMMEASKELEELLRKGYENGSVNEKAISDICIKFKLNKIDVLKWRDLV